MKLDAVNSSLSHGLSRAAFLVMLLAFQGAQARSAGGPPLVTEGPGTPDAGAWEINLAATLEDSGTSRLVAAPVLDLNYGWGERVQLKLEIPRLEERVDGATENGLGSWEIGVKWRFFESQRGRRLRASMYPQAELEAPGTARELAGESFVLPLQLAVSLPLLDVSGELGYAVGENEPDEWLAGVTAAHPLHQRASLVAEVYGRWDADENDHHIAAANLGGLFGLTEEVNVLVSIGRALRRASTVGPRLSAYVGLQFLR